MSKRKLDICRVEPTIVAINKLKAAKESEIKCVSGAVKKCIVMKNSTKIDESDS